MHVLDPSFLVHFNLTMFETLGNIDCYTMARIEQIHRLSREIDINPQSVDIQPVSSLTENLDTDQLRRKINLRMANPLANYSEAQCTYKFHPPPLN